MTLDLIDLYPDADNSQPYRRVTLFVNNSTHEIQKIELFHKTSAKVFSVTVNNATYDSTISDDIFKCECQRWPQIKDGTAMINGMKQLKRTFYFSSR